MKYILILLLYLLMISCKPYVIVLQCQHKGFTPGAVTTPGEVYSPMFNAGPSMLPTIPYTLTPWGSPRTDILVDTIKTGTITIKK